MDHHSNISANRLVTIKRYLERNPRTLLKKKLINFHIKSHEHIRLRNLTLNQAFKLYKESPASKRIDCKIGFQTFSKHVTSLYKKPFRYTDLCHFCEIGRKLLQEIKEFTLKKFEFKMEISLENLENFYNQLTEIDDQCAEIIEKINHLKSIDYHKEIAQRQRNAYNRDRKEIESFNGGSTIVIEIDYKQAITLSEGPRQLNSEYFEKNIKKVVC